MSIGDNDDRPPPSLQDLDARLRDARRNAGLDRPEPGTEPVGPLSHGALGSGARVGVELVAGLLVGVGGGLLIDRWLGTAPWGFIVMFFLGAGAGIVNVYRAVSGVGYAVGYENPVAKHGPGADGTETETETEEGRGRRG